MNVHPATVLIVDDDTLVRLDLRQMVTRLGHTVVGEADSGRQALSLVRSLRPDLVLLDMVLPSLSGLEVARALHEERLAPVVFLTGMAEEFAVTQVEMVGAMAFLSKPIRDNELGPAIVIAVARFKEKIALESEVRELNEKMEARKLVGRAKAILMEQQGLSEREAFRRIQTQSTTLNRPVQEIAKAIITASDIAG